MFNTLADKERVDKTAAALSAKGYEVFTVENGAAALAKIRELIPQGASVMNGASRTLEQIGFVGYLQAGAHGWNNLHAAILAEKDRAMQTVLRKQATLSDFYLGSVHALAENGEFVIASNTGSQLAHIVYTSTNLIFVVSTKKIVPTMADALKRLEEHVVPLEDQNMKTKYGMGTALNKVVLFKGESAFMGRKVRMVLVEEDLGF